MILNCTELGAKKKTEKSAKGVLVFVVIDHTMQQILILQQANKEDSTVLVKRRSSQVRNEMQIIFFILRFHQLSVRFRFKIQRQLTKFNRIP